jgi:hypothetical protein
LRVFLEPVRAAFRVQPNDPASLQVLLFFAVRVAPALIASLATAAVEGTTKVAIGLGVGQHVFGIFRAHFFFRGEDQFIVSTVSIVRTDVLQWVAVDDGLVSIRQRIVSIVSS